MELNIVKENGEKILKGFADIGLIIPDGVTKIGNYAFCERTDLTSVIIGNSVTEIGYGAFDSCYNLTSLTIGKGVTIIGDFAFSGCTNLESITIPNSVTKIGHWAFQNCYNLTIHGNAGSYAERYAKKNGIRFEVIDK